MTVKPYNAHDSKKEQVRAMFDNIAPHYDLLNHTLSFSIDRWWRRRTVKMVAGSRPARILDVATGTGDLALDLARRIPAAAVTGVDLSEKMLAVARCKVEARGLGERIALQQGDAEHLAFGTGSFDAVTVARDRRAYAYLPASVGGFPAPEAFVERLSRAGFSATRARSLSGGIAHVYTGEIH